MAFRTPTPRKSTDLQLGQCADAIILLLDSSVLNARLGRGPRARGSSIPGRSRRAVHIGTLAGALGRATCFASRLDLFRSPQVGLRSLYVFFRPRNLTLMPLQ